MRSVMVAVSLLVALAVTSSPTYAAHKATPHAARNAAFRTLLLNSDHYMSFCLTSIDKTISAYNAFLSDASLAGQAASAAALSAGYCSGSAGYINSLYEPYGPKTMGLAPVLRKSTSVMRLVGLWGQEMIGYLTASQYIDLLINQGVGTITPYIASSISEANKADSAATALSLHITQAWFIDGR